LSINTIITVSLYAISLTFIWGYWFDATRYPKEVLSLLAMSGIIVACCTKGLKPLKNKWLMWIFALGVFNTLILNRYLLPFVSQGNDKFLMTRDGIGTLSTYMAYKELLYLLIAIMTIWSISSVVLNVKNIVNALNVILGILIAYGFIQIIGFDQFNMVISGVTWHSLVQRIVGTLGNPSLFGIYLAMLVPFAVYTKRYWLAICGTIMTCCTLSATGIIGLCVAGLVMLYYSVAKSRLWVILASFFGVILFFILQNTSFMSFEGRYDQWYQTWLIIHAKPLTGYGLGTFEYYYMTPRMINMFVDVWREAHNEFLQAWFCLGLGGLALLILAVRKFIIEFLRNISPLKITTFASLSVVILAMLTSFPLRVAPISYLTVILLGILLNEEELNG